MIIYFFYSKDYWLNEEEKWFGSLICGGPQNKKKLMSVAESLFTYGSKQTILIAEDEHFESSI